ncbi:hypothetical protein CACC_01490 [Corynebacterium accolens]|nr:hypothetical protein CACC_01490 [Corynebacterium accolens]
MAGEGLELTGNQVAGDNAARALLAVVLIGDDPCISLGQKLHIAQPDLTVQCRGRGQLQLLTCLTTGVVVGETCTPPKERVARVPPYSRANGAPMAFMWSITRTDSVGQAPAVRLAAAVVAALWCLGVVSGVIIHLLGTGGVDTTLRSNRVRAARESW